MKPRCHSTVPLLCLLTAVVSPQARASETIPPPTASPGGSWQVNSYLEDAGLTDCFVLSLDFDDQGRVWVASADGLRLYDGFTWTRYSTADGLPSNFVRCVCASRDGSLWIGTDRGIAVRRIDGTIQIPVQHLAGPNVRRIVEDTDGTLWFCSDTWLQPGVSSGLSSLREGRWKSVGTADGLPSDYVCDYYRDSQGRQFVLTLTGLAQKQDRWVNVLGPNEYPRTIAETSSGDLIVSTTHAIHRRHEETWTRIDDRATVLPESKSLTRCAGGEVIGISKGNQRQFVEWKADRFTPISEIFETPGSIEQLRESPDGAIWCVGMGTLLRWARGVGEWREYPDLAPPQLVDNEDRVWFADERGVLRYSDNGHWERLDGAATRFARGGNGIVFGWTHNAIYRWSPAHMDTYHESDTGIATVVGHVLDTQGRSWLYGRDSKDRQQVTMFDGAAWHSQQPFIRSHGSIVGMQPHADGGMLILFHHRPDGPARLFVLEDATLQAIGLPPMTSQMVPGIHVDHSGRLYYLPDAHVYVQAVDGWSELPELPGRHVFATQDGPARSWFACDGVSGGRPALGCLTEQQWLLFETRIDRFLGSGSQLLMYSAQDGALYWPDPEGADELRRLTLPLAGEVRHAVRAPSGEVWVQVDEAVLRYRPDGIGPETRVELLDDAVIEGNPIAVRFDGLERFKNARAGSLEYSWRFGDGSWTPFASSPPERIPQALAAGTHTIEFRARDEGLDIDPSPQRMTVTIHPIPFQDRAWFWPSVIGTTGLLFSMLVACLLAWGKVRVERQHRTFAEQLRWSQKMEAVGTLAAGVAHEFNNLLTAITGYAERARCHSEPGGKAAEAIDVIDDVAHQAETVVGALLAFSRKGPSERARVRIDQLVAASIDLLRPALPSRIELKADLLSDAWVNADALQMQQVIVNLALNARDAMPEGGRLTIATKQGRCRIRDNMRECTRLIIEDSGKGIPEEVRHRMFEPFYTTKPRGEGTGLGLSIVYGIVAEHEGDIEVSPAESCGTRVVVTIPTCPASSSPP